MIIFLYIYEFDNNDLFINNPATHFIYSRYQQSKYEKSLELKY